MIKVIVLEPPMLSNVAWWRLWMPLMAIKRMYKGVFLFEFKRKELTYDDAWNADIVICPRPGGKPDVNEFLEKAKREGAKLIVDIDDHILGLPEFHDLYHDYKPGSEAHKNAVKTLQMADCFWFSTEKFLETYHTGGIVVKNAIPPEWLPETPAPDNNLWAWRGRSFQVHDLIYAGQDWYNGGGNAMAKHWLFLGWKPPLQHLENATSAAYIADTQEYIQKVRQSGFSGMWKPMVDCEFNDHKSNISWIEATLSGGACLTNYAGRPGWEHATDTFPDYEKICELWTASAAEIRLNYNLYTEADKRARSMLALCSHLLPTSADTANTLPTAEKP